MSSTSCRKCRFSLLSEKQIFVSSKKENIILSEIEIPKQKVAYSAEMYLRMLFYC